MAAVASEQIKEVRRAIALLRRYGYAVAAFSPKALKEMPVSEMESFLKTMGKEAIDEMRE